MPALSLANANRNRISYNYKVILITNNLKKEENKKKTQKNKTLFNIFKKKIK